MCNLKQRKVCFSVVEKNCLEKAISSSDFYNQGKEKIQSTMRELKLLTEEIEMKTDEWSVLIEKEEFYKNT